MPSIEELLARFAAGFNDIAHAIRAKTGKGEPLSIGEMATEQDAVFDAGKDAGTDAFWDTVQNNGKRTSYIYGFSNWAGEYIRPKYKIISTNVNDTSNTFSNCHQLKKVEAAYFDFSQSR